MTQDAAFGQAATFNTDVGFDLAVSPDKKAFTATFSGLEVIIQGTSAAPIGTRVFSFSIPLSGTDPGQEIPFTVQGNVLSEKEAAAHLAFSVNDQTTMVDFPVNSDSSFVQQLNYKALNAAAGERDSLAQRLANPNFTERAKPEAVEKARADHEAKSAEAERLRAALERLG